MLKRSSKHKGDLNRLAKSIVDEATIEHIGTPQETVNLAAVLLGRRGGLKGGKARAEKLTSQKRSEIAKKAAAARWSKDSKKKT